MRRPEPTAPPPDEHGLRVHQLRHFWRQAALTFLILFAWIGAAGASLALGRAPGRTLADAAPAFFLLAAISIPAASWLERTYRYTWPATMLALVGPISLGFGFKFMIPAIREMGQIESIVVVIVISTLAMLVCLFRFRLAGLVSPIATFAIIAAYLGTKGFERSGFERIEGLSPRGILAAIVDHPVAMATAGLGALALIALARQLEHYGGRFAIESARPLHLIGAAVVALAFSRGITTAPPDVAAAGLLVFYLCAVAWALHVDRIGVMLSAHLAMSGSMVKFVLESAGLELYLRDFIVCVIAVLAAGMVLWAAARPWAIRVGWTRRPRHIPAHEWPDRVLFGAPALQPIRSRADDRPEPKGW